MIRNINSSNNTLKNLHQVDQKIKLILTSYLSLKQQLRERDRQIEILRQTNNQLYQQCCRLKKEKNNKEFTNQIRRQDRYNKYNVFDNERIIEDSINELQRYQLQNSDSSIDLIKSDYIPKEESQQVKHRRNLTENKNINLMVQIQQEDNRITNEKQIKQEKQVKQEKQEKNWLKRKTSANLNKKSQQDNEELTKIWNERDQQIKKIDQLWSNIHKRVLSTNITR